MINAKAWDSCLLLSMIALALLRVSDRQQTQQQRTAIQRQPRRRSTASGSPVVHPVH